MRNLAFAVPTYLFVAACSSGGAKATTSGGQGGSGGGASSAASMYTDEVASAICANISSCCTQYAFKFDEQSCHAGVWGFLLAGTDLQQSGASIDASAVPACVAAATAWAKACVPTIAEQRAYQDACARVVTGPKPTGAACKLDADCAQPADGKGVAVCKMPSAATTAGTVCMVQLPAQQGASCVPSAPSFSNCTVDDTLYCSGVTSTCELKQPVGAPCNDDGGCVAGSYCIGTPSVCTEQAAVGQACGGTYGCADGNACDPSTKVCVARLANGQKCSQNDECQSGNCGSPCLPAGIAASLRTCGG